MSSETAFPTTAPSRRKLVAAGVIGVLVNPGNPTTESLTKDVQAAAATIGLQIAVLNATSEHEIDAGFATFVERRVDGVFIGGDG